MISAKLLNGNIISRDADFSKYIETVSEPGVIEGFVVSASKVGIGKARVPVSRSNGESLYVLVISDSETSISGNGDVYINIPQEIIDNGEIANEDGTGIATIEVGTMPSKNALKLATISNGAVTDERNILKKVSDLEPLISALDERTTTLEEEVGEILDKGAIDHLEESGLVGEKYTLSDTLFMQQSPLSSNCTLEANVGDVDANRQIHIQRMGSGTESNQIQLKLKKVGQPTQNLIVEVRRGVKVDVSDNEAYWYGDEVITSSEIAYGNITTDFAEYTVTFPESFGATQGELLNIVVRQNNDIVNSTNYYVIACDSTQYSEAYSYVSVNGTTRARSKLMPYCSSSGFAQSLLCKVNLRLDYYFNESEITRRGTGDLGTMLSVPIIDSAVYRISFYAKTLNVRTNENYIQVVDDKGNTFTTGTLTNQDYQYFILTDMAYFYGNNSINIYGKPWSSNNDALYIKDVKVERLWKNSTQQFPVSIYTISAKVVGTYSFVAPTDADLLFSRDVKKGSSSNQYQCTITINKNNRDEYSASYYSTNTTGSFRLKSVKKGDRIRIVGTTAASAQSWIENVVVKQIEGLKIHLRPYSIKPIGNIGVATSFGMINGLFKGGQFVGTNTSVTTGTIALGNAVGYLEVNYLGEIYKIPYYK